MCRCKGSQLPTACPRTWADKLVAWLPLACCRTTPCMWQRATQAAHHLTSMAQFSSHCCSLGYRPPRRPARGPPARGPRRRCRGLLARGLPALGRRHQALGRPVLDLPQALDRPALGRTPAPGALLALLSSNGFEAVYRVVLIPAAVQHYLHPGTCNKAACAHRWLSPQPAAWHTALEN